MFRQAEDGRRDDQGSRGLGVVYKRQAHFGQINFSKVAKLGLNGDRINPLDPIQLALYFAQIFQAGEKIRKPRQTEQGSSG